MQKAYGPFGIDSFRVGDRIEISPATDLWMRGARFGDVIAVGGKSVTVQMDALRRPIRVAPSRIFAVLA